jgi:hypothetical protein
MAPKQKHLSRNALAFQRIPAQALDCLKRRRKAGERAEGSVKPDISESAVPGGTTGVSARTEGISHADRASLHQA